MGNGSNIFKSEGNLSSPVCMAAEVAPGYFGLCCTNSVGDSSCESRVVAGMHEPTHTPSLQDQELADLQ